MKLYDNDSYRDEFVEFVYNLLAADETNDRANMIIDAFDSAPEIEAEPKLPNNPLTLRDIQEMAWTQSQVWCDDLDGCRAGLLCIQDDWNSPERTPHIWLLDEEGNSGLYLIGGLLKCGARFYRRKPEEGAV